LPATEVDNNKNKLPAAVLAPLSILEEARKTIPTKPIRIELLDQLGAFVIGKEVYINAGIITIALFDYNSLYLKADDAAQKFTRQNSLELGERLLIVFLKSGKQIYFSKLLESLEDWYKLDKLVLLLLRDSTVRVLYLDWELR
jgi:hypothetical protein